MQKLSNRARYQGVLQKILIKDKVGKMAKMPETQVS